ncbi:unnamed protein product [Schistosoma mattheei]|uniref:Uncharacterized protein n=1 Tax=Schistosoma mattheei TaxID=31246 RepID=A0AA85BL96_9TREM|nr:unnamed protein product [Schistosoma mattheei]
MRLYLPKLYLIFITNTIILSGVICNEIHSKSTEYGEHYIHPNDLLYPTLYENIEDDLTFNEMNDDNDNNNNDDHITFKSQQHINDRLFQPTKDHRHWLNTENIQHNQHDENQHEHQERIISNNLIKKITENLLKQSTMQQNIPTSPLSTSSSSSLPSSSESTASLLPTSSIFHSSSRSVLPNLWSKNSLYRPYRLKRDDLGWKRSIHYNV